MLSETWKPVVGYEGCYEVSSFGRVNSLKHTKPKILKLSRDFDGYRQVQLMKDGKAKYFRVHRLVAQAFIKNPQDKPQVNHKDCNRENNCVDNLEWVTQSENMRWAVKCGAQLGGNLGKHLSESTRKKLSDSRRGKKLSEETKFKISSGVKAKSSQISEHNPRRRQCKCLELGITFKSTVEAAKFFKVSSSSICGCLNDGHKLKHKYTLVEINRERTR